MSISIDPKSLGLSDLMSFVGDNATQLAQALGASAAAAGASNPETTSYSITPYSNVFVFGDSLSDVGNIYGLSTNALPIGSIYANGHFTNGPIWIQDYAAWTGLPAIRPSLSGGTDYAYGSAQTGTTPLHEANAIDLSLQFTQFQAANPHPAANALYTISAGSNDMLTALSNFASDPSGSLATVTAAVNNISYFVQDLARQGATNFAVLAVPDLGKAPTVTSRGDAAVTTASNLSKLFDDFLDWSMTTLNRIDNLNIHVVDTYKLLDEAVAHPSWFGLSNATTPVWSGNYTDAATGSLAASTPAAQNQYLFFDSLHPTAQGHAVVGAATYTSLSQQV